MKSYATSPYQVHLAKCYGWSDGAGSRSMRTEDFQGKFRSAYEQGYTDGQKSRKEFHTKSAAELGVSLSTVHAQ